MSFPASMLAIHQDSRILSAWAEIARHAGARAVEMCTDTQTAETHLGQGSFDLILCRLRLSPESGVRFIRRLRDGGIATPAVIISHNPDSRALLESLLLAQTEFLRAPFTLEEFQQSALAATAGASTEAAPE